MATYRVINDVHLFGADPIMTTHELVTAVTTSPYPVICNGDVIDIANCKYKELPQAMQTLTLLVDYLYKNNGVFILGNHCCDAIPAPNFVERGNVLFTHGDLWMWELDRALEFRMQKKGGGWFKRNLISRPLSALRHLVAVRPNDRLLAKIDEYTVANPHIKHVILGHSHPKAPVHFIVNGVSCTILPRGINDVELP